MSASKDRINRKQQIEAGLDKRTKAAAEAAAKRRKSNITYTVVGVLLVIFFAFIFIYNSTYPARHTTAVTIDGEKFTVADLNYHYSTSFNSFYNNYGSYISYGLFFDTNQSLADQMYMEDMSWREYFLNDAVQEMTQVKILYDAATEAGYTLSEEEQAAFDESIAQLETGWESLGYSSLEQFLNMNYGKGVDLELVKEESYRSYLASSYAQHMFDSYEYTQDDLTAYYAEHADEYDVFTYAYFSAALDEADAIQAAVDAVNGTSLEEFEAYVAENFEDASVSTVSFQGSSVPEGYVDFLSDAARVNGDAAALENGDSSVAVMFLERDANEYSPVAFRHVLIQAEDADGDGEFSQEEIDAAAARAEELYAQWKAGDATEDSFAELANTYSTDGGSNTAGGLYETVTKGQMVDPINDWLFDEARQPGDTEVISYDGANYTGTHIVYFVGTDEQSYADTIADNAMRNAAFSDWLQARVDAADVVTSHLKMAGKNH